VSSKFKITALKKEAQKEKKLEKKEQVLLKRFQGGETLVDLVHVNPKAHAHINAKARHPPHPQKSLENCELSAALPTPVEKPGQGVKCLKCELQLMSHHKFCFECGTRV
jgi:hypothetical protein